MVATFRILAEAVTSDSALEHTNILRDKISEDK